MMKANCSSMLDVPSTIENVKENKICFLLPSLNNMVKLVLQEENLTDQSPFPVVGIQSPC